MKITIAKFEPGSFAVIKSTGELVDVVAQDGINVLVKRETGAQWTHDATDLLPYSDEVCPI